MVKIAFWDNGLGERGTSVSLFDYAYFNQTILKNQSIVMYNTNHCSNNEEVIQRFKNNFKVFGVSDFGMVDKILYETGCDILYIIKEYYKYMKCNWQHLVPKFIDTNTLARGIKYSMPYSNKDDLIEYQYKIFHTRKKNVKSSLTFLGKENGVDHDYDQLHDAINDLDLNLKVWNKLKWQVEV